MLPHFLALGSLLATAAHARSYGSLEVRTLAAAGGWSLSVPGSCPAGTSSCFSSLTGNIMTSNRKENCCPSGTTPRLDCGTYVNTGQPYACCPLGNADCRGDVEKTVESSVCANSGWALWHIPDGGYNSFCCLPGQYGYWYKSLGQDAVGQCSTTPTLPSGSTPAVQDNNGDKSVDSTGKQLIPLPVPPATPAPTCDIVHYGWSLQTNTSTCTDGSSLCGYGGACCPKGLTCGTVIGDSEVPVCCPPGNPDCRGDVEGLWPQVCADSSWSLWWVNENGNHFCCKPGEIGYNRIHDVYAVGLCGTAVPTNTNTTIWMRSILAYEGDKSVAGSFAKYPCDSSPPPNSSWPNIVNSILNPPASLNPTRIAIGTGPYANYTTVNPITKPANAVTLVPVSYSTYLTTTVVNGVTTVVPKTSVVVSGAAAATATSTMVVTAAAGTAPASKTATASVTKFTGAAAVAGVPFAGVGLGAVAAVAVFLL